MDSVYSQLAERTNGDMYIGVVGPVRVGKSTFVKQLMEKVVIPNLQTEDDRRRAIDELPQSSAGPAIMTAEPKFVPAQGTRVHLAESSISFQVRFVDCVGYLIEGVKGHEDENGPRYVQTPWDSQPIPFEKAARIGTDKVIRDHSTLGIFVTTDGTVNGITRHQLQPVEDEMIATLQSIGKPFVVVLNSENPYHADTLALAEEMRASYNVPVIPTSVKDMSEGMLQDILKECLFEFPVFDVEMNTPDWIDILDDSHPMKHSLSDAIQESINQVQKIRDVQRIAEALMHYDFIEQAELMEILPGKGIASLQLTIEESYYQHVCDSYLDHSIETKKDWLLFLQESSKRKRQFDSFSQALEDAKTKGYGVTIPKKEDFDPSMPELVKQNQFFGVKMKAKAATYHVIRIDLDAEFSPLIGSEFHSKQLLTELQNAYQNDREELWETSLFGTPLHKMLTESMKFKVDSISSLSKRRMRETIERMTNDGERGMIAFIL
ncbi:stage IV sporulation protein A [Paenisporosarcina cavernae]|uniref:Stage IV sporulation protein A n=1 Tax=Paenisporosarcina cavernae TaxID=2320858 RepID=A0A385YSB0_9BACL|nr:stage IV sporulation protein A [Paenisporosarcina cavernae]AYC29381.1 stage IV sporulation protein A [Paenisporosarcina cavernae]